MNNNEIIAYQRHLINSVLIEEFIPEMNNKKMEILEKMLANSYLFSSVQVNILKKAKNELEEIRKEGNYGDWIITEAFIESLNEKEKAEAVEIMTYTPLTPTLAEYYLEKLKKQILLRRVV